MRLSPMSTPPFSQLPISADLVHKLEKMGITEPTPIQAAAIPVACEGKDLIGLAQTGTGKTLAFSLPMLSRLQEGEVGLILAPTRELAQQIEETLFKLGVSSALIVGGAAMSNQLRALKRRPQVLVATPGRLIDHLEQRTIRLNRISVVILDEADRMLDMGFAPAIKRILAQVTGDHQTMLFSATMPQEIEDIAQNFLNNPERIEVDRPGNAPDLVEQELIIVHFEEKHSILEMLLDENRGTVLVFARTRHGARKLAKAIRDMGHTAAEIHADRTLAQRREAMHGFKTGVFRVLVATDIAARGIDVKDISLVVNFDLPENSEDYLHRIGRTGRAGASGVAITLALANQTKQIRQIERLLGRRMDISPRSTAAGAAVADGRKPRTGSFGNLPGRSERKPRQDRPARQDFAPRAERPAREEWAPRPERQERQDWAPRPERQERQEWAPRPERQPRQDWTPREDRPAAFDRSQRPARQPRPEPTYEVSREPRGPRWDKKPGGRYQGDPSHRMGHVSGQNSGHGPRNDERGGADTPFLAGAPIHRPPTTVTGRPHPKAGGPRHKGKHKPAAAPWHKGKPKAKKRVR